MNRRQRKAAKRLAGGTARQTLVEQLTALGPCPDYTDADYTVEQAAAVARARVAWQHKRADIVAAHRKRSRISDAVVLQELHSPTVELSVDDPDDKRRLRRNVTRVRQSEAWRYNVLSAMQRQAETEMLFVWKLRTAGLGVGASNLAAMRYGVSINVDPSSLGGDAERFADLEATWRDFVAEARRYRIPVALVLRVLVEPRTLGDIEADYRLRSGAALFEYARALDLWAVLRGWSKTTGR